MAGRTKSNKTVSEKRQEIKEIINDEKEFNDDEVMFENVAQELTINDSPTSIEQVEEVLNNTITAVESSEVDVVPETKENDDLTEIQEGLNEMEESKVKLESVMQEGAEKAETFVKEELEKAKALKNKVDNVVKQNVKRVDFTTFWNGQSYNY